MFVIYLLFEILFLIAPYLELSLSSPGKDCSASTSIEKIPDTADCQYFHYCGKGFAKPLKQKCPNDQASGYNLWFNPTVGKCDHKKNAPATCTKVVNKTEPVNLNEDFKLEIDCADKGCGIFASRTPGACDSYVVCTNGEAEIRKCASGEIFDAKALECKPKSQGKCWKVKDGGEEPRRKGEAGFPNFTASEPYVINPDNSTILQSENITNWGEWQEWLYCPEGMFVIQDTTKSFNLSNANNTEIAENDATGVASVRFICETPGNNTNFKELTTISPGGDDNKTWPEPHTCQSIPAIGFQLNQVIAGGDDELGTNGIQVMCAYKKTKIRDRDETPPGQWTEPRFCGIHQAICGYQAQMHSIVGNRLRKDYDNTGLNNLRVKCCNVEDPLKTCIPNEARMFIRTCDNSKGEDILRCNFTNRLGYGANSDDNPSASAFYNSIGYKVALADSTQVIRIKNELIKKVKAGEPFEYKWNTKPAQLWKQFKKYSKHIYANPFEKFDLYQIVAKCFHFVFMGSRYVKVVKDEEGKTLEETYLEVNISAMAW